MVLQYCELGFAISGCCIFNRCTMKNIAKLLFFAIETARTCYKFRSRLCGLLACSFMLSLTACSQVVSVRYNMEVSVNDNGKIFTGSGVWQETVTEGFFFPGVSHKGDAIPVSIGQRGTLFLLVAGSDEPGSWAPTAFENAFYGNQLFGEKSRIFDGKTYRTLRYVDQLKEIRAMNGATKELDCSSGSAGSRVCPFMVTFRDLSDPKSVVVLDPRDIGNVFGPGVTLNPIRITITRKRVTTGRIEKVLPWLKQYQKRNFLGEEMTKRSFRVPDARKLLTCWEFSSTSIFCGGF
jgi:hypothetical protein